MKDFTNLKEAIHQYLVADGTSQRVGAAKARVTRLVKDLAEEFGSVTVRELALSFVQSASASYVPVPDQLQLLLNRFTFGSLYVEGQRPFGWHEESQAQAEELPLYYFSEKSCEVSYSNCPKQKKLWEQRGFHLAEDLPVIWRSYSNCLEVVFPIKRSLIFLEYGYALPCQLQWRWDNEGFIVTRSIISSGFWCAWKWWSDAKYWYLEKRPELFAELDWWGEEMPHQRFEPEDDPYAAVLGGR